MGHEAGSRKLNSRPWGTLKLDQNRHTEIGRESIENARGLLRCPVALIAPVKPGAKPVVCPKCKSPYWNRPRQRPAGHGRKPTGKC